MARGENFRGKRGPGRREGSKNRATPEIREVAGRLVEDREYQASLLRRLRAGTAGQIEVHLFKLAFGLPRQAEVEVDHETHFEAMREAALRRLARDPRGAGVLEGLFLGLTLDEALLRADRMALLAGATTRPGGPQTS